MWVVGGGWWVVDGGNSVNRVQRECKLQYAQGKVVGEDCCGKRNKKDGSTYVV
jgi:uncharacterized membrane protein